MKILITGGMGFIGTHICVELLNQGQTLVVIDNLSNSNLIAMERVAKITGKKLSFDLSVNADIVFCNADVRDRNTIQQIFQTQNISAVIHLAGLKAVSESIKFPLHYYNNNVTGTVVLLEEMARANVKTLVFSSSATVYGNPKKFPIKEDFPTGRVTNPYAQSKLIIEQILKDLQKSDPNWRICLLRYFNPVGAHPSGTIGQDPNSIPDNLMPCISQVAIGKLGILNIYGNDYDTEDGTCIRDYIHVVDLARGHHSALNYLNTKKPNLSIFNLGTGKGSSVYEIVQAFREASGMHIPCKVLERRAGDIAESWTSTERAEKFLGWKAQYNLNQMCEDTWRWQQQNPYGYKAL